MIKIEGDELVFPPLERKRLKVTDKEANARIASLEAELAKVEGSLTNLDCELSDIRGDLKQSQYDAALAQAELAKVRAERDEARAACKIQKECKEGWMRQAIAQDRRATAAEAARDDALRRLAALDAHEAEKTPAYWRGWEAASCGHALKVEASAELRRGWMDAVAAAEPGS